MGSSLISNRPNFLVSNNYAKSYVVAVDGKFNLSMKLSKNFNLHSSLARSSCNRGIDDQKR